MGFCPLASVDHHFGRGRLTIQVDFRGVEPVWRFWEMGSGVFEEMFLTISDLDVNPADNLALMAISE